MPKLRTDESWDSLKAEAELRMREFDGYPPHVREIANEHGLALARRRAAYDAMRRA